MSIIQENEHEFRKLSFLWSLCYDTKDWQKLVSICSPDFKMYYGDLDPKLGGDKIVPAQTYVDIMSAQTALGDSRLKTQHFLGAVLFEQEEDGSVIGDWQVQGLHRRELDDGSVAMWNGYNYVRHYYRRDADGSWKLDGIKPTRPFFMDGAPQNVIGQF